MSSVISPILVFKVILAILGAFNFYSNFRVSFTVWTEKHAKDINLYHSESTDKIVRIEIITILVFLPRYLIYFPNYIVFLNLSKQFLLYFTVYNIKHFCQFYS